MRANLILLAGCLAAVAAVRGASSSDQMRPAANQARQGLEARRPLPLLPFDLIEQFDRKFRSLLSKPQKDLFDRSWKEWSQVPGPQAQASARQDGR